MVRRRTQPGRARPQLVFPRHQHHHETNTKDEKARFIEQAYAQLAALIGEVHEVSYIHVVDARAAAYGYGGQTQEHRYQAARIAASD